LVSAVAVLSTLLAQAASAFSLVKFAEAACLIYLGSGRFWTGRAPPYRSERRP